MGDDTGALKKFKNQLQFPYQWATLISVVILLDLFLCCIEDVKVFYAFGSKNIVDLCENQYILLTLMSIVFSTLLYKYFRMAKKLSDFARRESENLRFSVTLEDIHKLKNGMDYIQRWCFLCLYVLLYFFYKSNIYVSEIIKLRFDNTITTIYCVIFLFSVFLIIELPVIYVKHIISKFAERAKYVEKMIF